MVFIKAVTIFQRKHTFSKTSRVSIKMTAMNLIKVLFISIETAHIFEDQSLQHTDDICEFHKRLFLSKSETPNFPNRAWLKKWSAQYIFYIKKRRLLARSGGDPGKGPKTTPNRRDPKPGTPSIAKRAWVKKGSAR